jgi:hypothetical protein
MFFFRKLISFIPPALIFVQAVLAGGSSGSVTLINATPYDWELSSSHSYQVDWNWPKTIPAGTSHEQYVKFNKDHHDDGAEAYYSLVKSPTPASFAVKARPPKHIEIQFQDQLSSLNNPEHSTLNLGWVENGDVCFVLSGNGDGPYISSNPPVGWMQSTLSSIGSKSLREISMPASHDSGMNEVTHHRWGGRAHNTVTQSKDTFQQLIGGARIFDIRPVHLGGTFYCGHFSQLGSLMVGGTGRKIENIVKDINSFNSQHPGELIIIDISHQMNTDKKFRDLTPALWENLFHELVKIEALWFPPTSDLPDDLSTLPLSSFIAPGSKSSVLVRLPNGAPLPQSPKRKRDVLTVATFSGTMSAGPGDGMSAQGPALEGDEKHDPTDNDGGKFPDVDEDDNSLDDSNSSSEEGTPVDAGPTSATMVPIPTQTASGDKKPLEIPATVTVHPIGNREMAFFHESRLPISGSYSDTNDSAYLARDQLAKLAQHRPSPKSDIHKSTWTITQRIGHILDVANKKTSITADAAHAHKVLFGKLWGAMSRTTYPNMIEVDDIHDGRFTALCMAINDYFVSPRVGPRQIRNLRNRSTRREAVKKVLDVVDESRGEVKPMFGDETMTNSSSRVRIQYQA